MHDGAAAGQHDALHDVVAVRQLRRLRVLVPERGEEGQQVARIERGGGDRDPAGPVVVAEDRDAVRRDDPLAGHGRGTVAAGVGGEVDDHAAGLMASTIGWVTMTGARRPMTSAVQITRSFLATVVAISSACFWRNASLISRA